MARRAAYGLNERPLRAQETLLVRVEDRYQRHLGQVQPLAQEVDPDEHVEFSEAQVADDFHALDRLDLRVQVAHLDAVLGEVIGELLGHALGERGDQHALVPGDPQGDLAEQVVHLSRRGTYLEHRVHQPSRPHHLLHDLPRALALVFRRRSRHEHRLAHHVLEFLELERAVVECGRQAEPVGDEVLLARAVTTIHSAELADRDVRLVDEHEGVRRQVVDQRRRRLAFFSSGQVPRIIFDPLAEAELVEHFEVEARALLDPLGLEELSRFLKVVDSLGELDLDRFDRPQRRRARRHIVARRIDGEARDPLAGVARERVEQGQTLDLVVDERDAQCGLGMLRGEDVEHVASHAERAALELELVSLVLHRHQARNDVALRHLLFLAHVKDHAVIVDRIADTVDARDSRDDHGVLALEQRLGRRQPHLLDVLVDARVLLDVEITRRNVGLGLVVVVVRDEILDGILGKELAHLRVELRREGLVGSEDQRRTAEARDDVRHGERLTRAGNTEESLVRESVANAIDELLDRLGLIARGRKSLGEPERTVWESEHHCGCGGMRCSLARRGALLTPAGRPAVCSLLR